MKSDNNSGKKSIKCISNKSIDKTLQTPTNTAKVLSDVDVTDWDKDVKKTKVEFTKPTDILKLLINLSQIGGFSLENHLITNFL